MESQLKEQENRRTGVQMEKRGYSPVPLVLHRLGAETLAVLENFRPRTKPGLALKSKPKPVAALGAEGPRP